MTNTVSNSSPLVLCIVISFTLSSFSSSSLPSVVLSRVILSKNEINPSRPEAVFSKALTNDERFSSLPRLIVSSFSSSYSFLNEYLLSKIGKVKSYHPIDSCKDNVSKTIEALNKELNAHPLDVAFICIGENGHLAFNDPPADFDTTDPYILVNLERRSRKQQVSEGWFKNLDDVPEEAITMSVSQILSSKHIIVSCPDQRKAKAVAACLFEDISPLSPSSALRYAASCSLYLDRLSSCLVFGDRRTN